MDSAVPAIQKADTEEGKVTTREKKKKLLQSRHGDDNQGGEAGCSTGNDSSKIGRQGGRGSLALDDRSSVFLPSPRMRRSDPQLTGRSCRNASLSSPPPACLMLRSS